MKRSTLYSSSARTARPASKSPVAQPRETPAQAEPPVVPKAPGRIRGMLKRAEKPLLLAIGGLVVLGLVLAHGAMTPKARELTQEDIDGAVRHSLEAKPLPS